MSAGDKLMAIFIVSLLTLFCFGIWSFKTGTDLNKAVSSGHLMHNGRLYIIYPAKVVEDRQ